ncbi:MAG: hypothetical protein ABI611_05850 [Solirubrobacteraceae bacterium]
MKTVTTLSLIGALALSTTAFADDSTPSPDPTTPSASKQCRSERSAMGLKRFRMTYGTNKTRRNAFGKCVSKRTHATTKAATEAKQNAAKDCKAEKAADPAAFTAKYGTGKHGANAFGKCVSQLAKSRTTGAVDDEVKADVKAAKACKTERKTDPAAFSAKYGTSRNKRNAFGKCVSRHSTAQQTS